jgi:low temperature requirement protein LtrA
MSDQSVRNAAEQKYEVTPLELFFDLVFAFSTTRRPRATA